MSRSAEEWQEVVTPMLEGISRYNPDNMETLEEYVQFQTEGTDYDFDANLTLMKLYQFQPTRSNPRIALLILLKALVNMPKSDFLLLKSVLPQNIQQDEAVERVVHLHCLLESCQLQQLWEEAEEVEEVVGGITDFKAQIRQYICSVLEVSYQSIATELLREYVGGLEDSDLLKLISGRGWQVAGETVHIRKQEDLIKPKKILAKIDMESVQEILRATAK